MSDSYMSIKQVSNEARFCDGTEPPGRDPSQSEAREGSGDRGELLKCFVSPACPGKEGLTGLQGRCWTDWPWE